MKRLREGNVVLPSYDIAGKIGNGTHGTVFMAVNKHDMSTCVVKRIPTEIPHCDAVSIVALRELIIMKRIQHHPNIIRLLHIWSSGTSFMAAMEYLPTTIHVWCGKLETTHVRSVITQLSSAVGHCHALHVMHRDLKPENVLIDAHLRVKLIDFGLATVFPRRQYTMDVYTMPYRAPEVTEGRYTHKADLWALGCIMYELDCGRRLFNILTFDELRAALVGFAPQSLRMRCDLCTRILRCVLDANPDLRPEAKSIAGDISSEERRIKM